MAEADFMIQEPGVQTRQIWDITDLRPGIAANNDPGRLKVSRPVKSDVTDRMLFGIFVVQESRTVRPPETGDTTVLGVLLEGIGVTPDSKEDRYAANDMASIARRGYYTVRVDPDNAPAVGGAVFISIGTDIEGYLTDVDDADSYPILKGVEIESVSDNTAVVFLEGKAVY